MASLINGKKDAYDVGYGKPPKHTQFVKGQSGNPKGRPKGRKNHATIFREVCEERIWVNGKNGPQSMTKYRAAVTQLANKAVQGDFKSIREVKASYESSCQTEVLLNPPSLTINFVESPDRTTKLRPNAATEKREQEEN